MSKRSPKSVEEKLEAVQLYLNQSKSVSWISNTYEVAPKTVDNWIRKYKQEGIDGLILLGFLLLINTNETKEMLVEKPRKQFHLIFFKK